MENQIQRFGSDLAIRRLFVLALRIVPFSTTLTKPWIAFLSKSVAKQQLIWHATKGEIHRSYGDNGPNWESLARGEFISNADGYAVYFVTCITNKYMHLTIKDTHSATSR